MKLKDIAPNRSNRTNSVSTTSVPCDDYSAKRSEAHPEIAELLNARTAKVLFNHVALAGDEMEFANFIINKLDADPLYIPSETLLQVIRTIDDKIGGTDSMHGMIRTA